MARAGTWSVKGIDQETRAFARVAAERGELPIGAWIDRAIRARTGLPPAEIDQTPPRRKAAEHAADGADGQQQPATARRRRAVLGLGGAWYAVGGLLLAAMIGGGTWILERSGGDRPVSKSVASNSATPAATAQGAVPVAPPGKRATPEANGSIALLLAKAERDNPAAQYDLGLIYARGEVTARNDKEAAHWFEAAAKHGLPAAQYNLAVAYEQGRGVPRDLSRAFHWYRSAAEQGHAQARHNLGVMLADGKGTRRDYDKAAYWFGKAAEAGIAESDLRLGMLHEGGLGRPRNLAKAAEFYRRAVAKGNKAAAQRLAALASKGTAAAKAAPAAVDDSALDAKGIAELQNLLGRLELSPGPADGRLGDKTVAAIRMYQEFAGLPVDGKPTRNLLGDLRQVVDAMRGNPEAGPSAQ